MRRVCGAALAAAFLLAGTARGETLEYKIIWPSGASLGTARLELTGAQMKPMAPLTARMMLDASFPGVPVTGEFHSTMDGKGCTQRFEKRFTLALRKSDEVVTVSGGRASRKTGAGGGESAMAVPACAHDALAFLQFVRRELKAGRVPAGGKLLFGAQYDVTVKKAGPDMVAIGGGKVDAERFIFHVKGPASESEFEILFSQDMARTPLEVRVDMAVGKFRLELAP